MKFRKLIMVLVTMAFVALLSLPVFAANMVELGRMTATNNANQMGWATDGTDGNSTSLMMEDLAANKFLVLELGAAPAGGMQFIWQGDGNAWAWDQTDGVIPDEGTSETLIVIDLSKTAKGYAKMIASTQVKFFLGYWSNTVADLKITNAYLTDEDPRTAAAAPAADAAPADAAPVVAAGNIVELTRMDKNNGPQQMGWASDGELGAADLSTQKYLVLELGTAPVGGVHLIWQGDGDDWTWDQTEGIVPDEGSSETTIVIDLSKSAKNYSKLVASSSYWIYVAYYSNNVADLKVNRAYLTDVDPKAAAASAAPAASGGGAAATSAVEVANGAEKAAILKNLVILASNNMASVLEESGVSFDAIVSGLGDLDADGIAELGAVLQELVDTI
ncbi:MAG: hypothetical protein LBS21_10475 [Clostridiales bacterium]|jgi:hypothetical protein|nr:hypothetical protein [Clostridiales bacterium]